MSKGARHSWKNANPISKAADRRSEQGANPLADALVAPLVEREDPVLTPLVKKMEGRC